MKRIKKLPLLLVGISLAGMSQAGLLSYEVTNYNDGNGKHSLWTNNDFGKDRFFSAQSGLQFIVDDNDTASVEDDMGRLFGSTRSGSGRTAYIDLVFSGGMSSLDFEHYLYKQENGLGYNSLLPHSPVFFKDVLGSIAIGDSIYDVDANVAKGGKSHVAQFGVGANAKNAGEFGFSSWLKTCAAKVSAPGAHDCMESDHWDINIGLTPDQQQSNAASVPEPGVIGLLAAGIAGLFATRKK